MDDMPKTYNVSDFERDDITDIIHAENAINRDVWKGFPPQWVRIVHSEAVRRDDGRWTVSMRVAVDPDEWAIRVKDFETRETSKLYRPYEKADFGRVIPADVVLTEIDRN